MFFIFMSVSPEANGRVDAVSRSPMQQNVPQQLGQKYNDEETINIAAPSSQKQKLVQEIISKDFKITPT